MSLKDVIHDIEGYQNIKSEIEVLKKYGFDHGARRGQFDAILEMLHPKSLRLRVSEIIDETKTTKTLRMVPVQGYLPPFQAGQYISLVVEVGGVVTSRDYSISSSPSQIGYFDITVRRVGDGFVSEHLLEETKQGDEFTSSAPAGNFYYNPLIHGRDLVFIAGGSGITPFMSMIREVTGRGLDRRIHLFYGCQWPDDIIFGQEIDDLSRRHADFTCTTVISEPPVGYRGHTGFITARLMQEILGGLSEKMFFLCGPEAMYAFCREELKQEGIPERKMRTEMYGPPRNVTTCPGWPEHIDADARVSVSMKGGETIMVRSTEPLMNSLERHGIAIPSLCRSGECSLCRTKLLKGRVFQPEGVKLRKSDRQFGYIHPCMAYPISDIEILLP